MDELIATEFFSNHVTVWGILSDILKVTSPILWGIIHIFDLNDHFHALSDH